MASERARERTVHRYYQTWLESSVGFQTTTPSASQEPERRHADGSSLRASKDKTLIAFAQLGCLKLNAKRGIVTLIGSSRQYILAEATKSTSLVNDGGAHDTDDELWFGNASLPRKQGISQDALAPPTYTAIGNNDVSYTCPALVVNDFLTSEKYSHHTVAGKGVSFYCGVPIISPSGYRIGVYNVTDDKPRDGLTPRELKFMHDMATAVMDHLETVRQGSARSRGEQLVLGLGQFISGDASTTSNPESRQSTPPSPKEDPFLPAISDVDDTTNGFSGLTITNADPTILKNRQQSKKIAGPTSTDKDIVSTLDGPERKTAARAHSGLSEKHKRTLDLPSAPGEHNTLEGGIDNPDDSAQINRTFSRAADILRECAGADGVVFYDAKSTNLARHMDISNPGTGRDSPNEGLASYNSSDDDYTDQSSDTGSSHKSNSRSSSLSEIGDPNRVLSSRGKRSAILGYSIDVSVKSTASARTIKTLGLKEQSLRRFIRRYPQGKTFNFTAEGDIVSDSDSVEGDRASYSSRRASVVPSASNVVAAELIKIVPGARTVIWLPLWDFSSKKWCAGTFLWSQRPEKLLHGQEDLTYLRTFGSCIMGEVARIEALSSDATRSTFLANISHELRSPLHGILGSVEFLQDTPLNAFQSTMTTAVETCGKTLLDTVDHVLEYAKINHLSKSLSDSRKRGKRTERQQNDKKGWQNESALINDFDLATVVEEVVEAVYAGQTFRTANPINRAGSPFDGAHQPAEQPAEQIRSQIQRGSSKFSGKVRLVLDIEQRSSWMVHGQPGAIRRIVMNILGNALKYTDKGTIKVSLWTSVRSSTKQRSGETFNLTVVDTGKGMSSAFLQNHAFTAFTQESKFSDGAGLGLSIVRQLVNALGGSIDVTSEQGTGTEVQVRFSLPTATPNGPLAKGDDQDDLLPRVRQATHGMSLCMLNPKNYDQDDRSKLEQLQDSGFVVESAILKLTESWFSMRTMTSRSMDGISTDFFVYAEPPPIEYLLEHHGVHAKHTEVPVIVLASNAFEAASLSANGIHQLTDIGRVVEIISQPCGPQKFAKALHRSLARTANLARDPKKRDTAEPADLDVCEDPNVSQPYLGDSDSQHSQEQRLGRNHSDHPQPQQNRERLPEAHIDKDTHKEKDDRGLFTTPRSQPPSEASSAGLDLIESHPKLDTTSQKSPLVRPTFSRQSTAGASNPETANLETPMSPITPFPSSSSAPRVLLVDDNEINLNLLIAFMKKARLPYECARDGLQALQAYREASSPGSGPAFQHVLMDISMPVMNGIAATEEIRRYEKRENIAMANIVALTGQASEEVRNQLFKAGGNYFMTKPVRFKELVSLLKNQSQNG